MAVKPIPEGFHTVTPYLIVKGAADLMEFLKNAFNAAERDIHKNPDGSIMHAEMNIGDSIIMLGEANDKFPPMPSMHYLYVDDVDKFYKQAVAAGAKSDMEPEDMFWGDRNAGVWDPVGNYWSISTHVKDVSQEEMEAAVKERMKEADK